LTDAGSVPLAVRRVDPRPEASQVLLPGSTLMLFTDGLVERRHESIDDGLDRVADALVDTSRLSIDALADEVLRKLSPAGGYDDDVAMVVYRHQPAPLRIETDATAEQLGPLRRQLTTWLRNAGVPESLAGDIVLVINEACSNSIEHAYRGQSVGTMRLEVESLNGEVRAVTSDHGSWKPPAADPGYGGRGLLLIRELGDWVEIDSSPTGTTIKVNFGLP
jgi:anti-sigma regulatory factor (Ser/Thr protein kinase)